MVEVILPNRYSKLLKLLKKDLNKVLCKVEVINKTTYFILGNSKIITCTPLLVNYDIKKDCPFSYEYKQVNRYHVSFILQENPQGFNYPISNFFSKQIVKEMSIELAYLKELIIYNFIKHFDNIFNFNVIDIIYELLERQVTFYQLDGDIFMATEYRHKERDINIFQACSIKLFFKGLK
jgi:hypothetical protein